MRYKNIEQVKQILPDVKARYGHRVYLCLVSGRKERFAKVTPWKILNQEESFEIIPRGMEFSWDAILRVANNHRLTLNLA